MIIEQFSRFGYHLNITQLITLYIFQNIQILKYLLIVLFQIFQFALNLFFQIKYLQNSNTQFLSLKPKFFFRLESFHQYFKVIPHYLSVIVKFIQIYQQSYFLVIIEIYQFNFSYFSYLFILKSENILSYYFLERFHYQLIFSIVLPF
ncbi:unnamed protein product (macronuclear) [Paramecium tetraurelia]|uniref:Transmembrane protein n=1 Tax=Paramecium tetraurelia TaxID=5888 RepID=A0C0P2_PARTE|nr:uncharacterized protein GSPATT00033835001 [Paramecium tetraurelia]CAK64359.1 unnamed protein product [Paramecium tetraurelia]|eukprot:XP_001431757.1 hypothetical protein (macronuclear) [Paramecium tetraurelia strain d4-2]